MNLAKILKIIKQIFWPIVQGVLNRYIDVKAVKNSMSGTTSAQPSISKSLSHYTELRALYQKYGGRWDRNINIGGIRNNDDFKADRFNDVLFIAYVDEYGQERVFLCGGTTDPGIYYTEKPMGEHKGQKAAFRMCVGFYENVYKVGRHRDIYPALRLCGPIKGVRDLNRNGYSDADEPVVVKTEHVNIHPASQRYVGKTNELINRWSAGCQVVWKYRDWQIFINIVLRSVKYLENSNAVFSYMLFDKNQVSRNLYKMVI